MAGGAGERFWPLSTPEQPKQLLDLTGSGKSLLEQAVDRLAPCVDEVFISTSETLAAPLRVAGLVPEENVLAEPCKRNTAGALVWCMAAIPGDRPFLAAVTTADHAISPDRVFRSDVEAALRLAEQKHALVTIGIRPTRAETGFGYVQIGVGTQVLRFTEKPDAETAANFVSRGNYLWNSGMFFWRSDAFGSELSSHAPAHAEVYEALLSHAAPGVFASLPSVSIDYALMEKSQNVHCIQASFSWDDVGTWDSLLRTVPLDTNGNAVVGDATLIDTRGCVIYNASTTRLSVLGAEGLAVIATERDTLVVPLALSQDVRRISAHLNP